MGLWLGEKGHAVSLLCPKLLIDKNAFNTVVKTSGGGFISLAERWHQPTQTSIGGSISIEKWYHPSQISGGDQIHQCNHS